MTSHINYFVMFHAWREFSCSTKRACLLLDEIYLFLPSVHLLHDEIFDLSCIFLSPYVCHSVCLSFSLYWPQFLLNCLYITHIRSLCEWQDRYAGDKPKVKGQGHEPKNTYLYITFEPNELERWDQVR